MNRDVWLPRAAILSAILAGGMLALFVAGSGGGFSSRARSGPPDPYQTRVGAVLNIPDCFAFDWAEEWRYSPNGSRMALEALGAVWVWTVGTADVRQFSAVPEGESRAASFGTFMWTDDQHILASEYRADAACDARLGDRPPYEDRWVLLDAATGARLRRVTDEVNGGPDGLDVVGVVDADIWYIKARDGKLRTYDSRTGTLGEEEYFDYNAGRGSAHQVSPGSPWFSAFVPADPGGDPWRGRLEVFNIQSAERRIAEDGSLAAPLSMMLMTPDARYLFHGYGGDDGKFVPLISDLAYGIERGAPPGERWVPYAVSAARGVLLVMVPPEPLPDLVTIRTCEMAEVPLDYLTQY